MPTVYGADVEGDDLLPGLTKLWCASFAELDEDRNVGRSWTETTYEGIGEMFANPDNILLMHNGYSYDKRAIEKILKIEVKAEIIDTLIISYYLYPKLMRHGLAWHGEDLGIAKPVIDNWEELSLGEYVHRCEEDVRIQVALWKQMWKHLRLLYVSDDEAWHLVRHLSFKAKCTAMQEQSRWKLDVPECENLLVTFNDKYEEARLALEARMPPVPQYSKKNRPKKPFKRSGEKSALGQKWEDIVNEHTTMVERGGRKAVDWMEEIKVLSGYKPPNAGASGQMKDWLYSLGWVPETFKYVRDKDTNEQRRIPQIKNADTGELCPSVERLIKKDSAIEYLREMSVVKHRISVCNGFLNNVDSQNYVVATYQGLTNTLRLKHKICVNLPSTRKPYGLEIRGLLKARNNEVELCGSDMSSLEDRTKQHFMWVYDPEYVKEMQTPGFDPHLDMAEAARLITGAECEEYKVLKSFGKDQTPAQHERFMQLDQIRHGGKSTNYAATYGAKGPTIARSAGVPEAIGEKLYDAYWRRNWSLNAIADNCTVKQSRGMKWLWNPVAKIWYLLKAEKDRFSTLNQGTGAYAFDRWLYHVIRRRPQLTAQFHDEGIWELKVGNREAMTKILKDAIHDVNVELKLNRDLDCDVDFADNYAGVH